MDMDIHQTRGNGAAGDIQHLCTGNRRNLRRDAVDQSVITDENIRFFVRIGIRVKNGSVFE